MIIPVYLLFYITQLETSGSAFPPYYVSCVSTTQMKQWEANSSTFQAPKEEHFRQKLHYAHLRQSFLSQLDSGESAGINPGMLQLLSCMISHFLFCWFHLPCAFGTADDNSTRLLFMQDFLCGKDSLGSSC